MQMYETVDHTGDIALRLTGAGFGELVVEGVRGIASILFDGEPDRSAPRERWTGRVAGIDREDVLVRALSEALHWMEERDRVPLEVGAEVTGPAELEIALGGVRADGERCRRVEEIKAVTYHAVEIRESAEGLSTVVVLDV
jgi:SHS2 domain-containing protein